MSNPLGKTTESVLHRAGGTSPALERGSVLRKNPQETPAQLPPLGRQQLIRETQAIVLHFPIKELAEQQDTTERAVESQRNGESSFSFLAAVNMCRSNPRARAMVGRLLGFSGHYTDPDFMQGMEQVVAYMLQQKQQAEDGAATAADEAMLDLFGPTRGNA